MIRVLYILLVCIFLSGAGTEAATKNRIMFSRAENIIQNQGDSLIITLTLDSAVQLVHGYRVRFGFDTSVLRLEQITATPAWASGGNNFFFYKDTVIVDTIAHDTSLYDLGSYFLGRSLHIDGYADIARLKFTALSTGATFLHFNFVLVQDTLLQPVLNARSDAVIFVCPLPDHYTFYGDLTHNNFIDLADLSTLIAYLTTSMVTLKPTSLIADWNCSGVVDLTDLSSMIAYLILSHPKPCNLCPPTGAH